MTMMTTTTTMIMIIIQISLEPLLVRRHSFLVLDLGLDIVNGARCLKVHGDGLVCERLVEDLRS